MENNRYGNINELISEIEALGDWRDTSQRSNFLKVLSKIAVIYHGYEIENEGEYEDEETTIGYYPKEVTDAIVEVCKAKFPSDDKEVFDEEGNLKEGYPEYFNLLFLVKDGLGISILGERTRIDEIAREEFGIDVYDTTATREEVDALISSSKEYLDKKKEQELNGSATSPERQEKEASIRKSQAEKQAIVQQITEIDKEIEVSSALLNEKKAKRDDLLSSVEEK